MSINTLNSGVLWPKRTVLLIKWVDIILPIADILHLFQIISFMLHADEKTDQSTQSSLGYIMALHYSDQLTGSCANVLNLQCLAGHHLDNVRVVEPFLLMTNVLGINLSSYNNWHNLPKENSVKLSNIFDIKAWSKYSDSRHYSPLVSWESFIQKHPPLLILVYHTWTLECSHQNHLHMVIRDATKNFVQGNGFEIVRHVCLDFRKTNIISPKRLIDEIYGTYNPSSVVVIFNVWGGIILDKVTNYRLAVSGTRCNRLNDQRLSRHSELVSRDVIKYTSRFMNNTKKYVAVMIRFEYYGIKHKLINQSPESQRRQLLECFQNIGSKLESLKHDKSIKHTLLTMDFSKHGSKDLRGNKSPYLNMTVLNETVPKLFEVMFGKLFDQDEWERSFVSVAQFKVPGYIAIMQKTLAANSDCLLLVGGGSFQESAKTLHNELHPGAGCIIELC